MKNTCTNSKLDMVRLTNNWKRTRTFSDKFTMSSHNTSHQISSHYTTLLYTTLHYTTLHYTTLYYTTLHYTVLTHTCLDSLCSLLATIVFIRYISRSSDLRIPGASIDNWRSLYKNEKKKKEKSEEAMLWRTFVKYRMGETEREELLTRETNKIDNKNQK